MTNRSIAFMAFATTVIATLSLTTPQAAAAASEDCLQCKHVDCLRGLIKQKTALAAGYDQLATKWDRFVRVEGQGADVINFNSLQPQYRNSTYLDLLDKYKIFAQQEDAMAEQVGPPAGCSFSAGLSASTDTYETCKIDDSLKQAQEQAPCKQIAELMGKHETLHRKQCLVRRDDRTAGDFWRYTAKGANGATAEKYLPPLMQTPAGHAREEAAAYRMELETLNKLLPKAEAKCKISFKGVKTSCHMSQGKMTMTMGQDIAGKVCGNPATATWTINTVSWVRAPYIGERRNVDPPWKSDCVEKGSAEERRREAIYRAGPGKGWMCVYEPGDRPKITIRYFRLPQCSPNTEQTITVTAERSECDEDAPQQPPRDPDMPVS